uniref:Uncharacterized protein n=1 Tax=Setaria italica TaxID=4555 RepID=K3YFT3_SETIT
MFLITNHLYKWKHFHRQSNIRTDCVNGITSQIYP